MKHRSIPVVALTVATLALAGNARAAAPSANRTDKASAKAASAFEHPLADRRDRDHGREVDLRGRGDRPVEPDRTAPPVPGLSRGVQEVVVTTPVAAIECNDKRMNGASPYRAQGARLSGDSLSGDSIHPGGRRRRFAGIRRNHDRWRHAGD